MLLKLPVRLPKGGSATHQSGSPNVLSKRMTMPGPIKPKEVQKKRNESFPEEVFDAFNEMIVKEWDGHSASFTLKSVADLAIKKLKEGGRNRGLTRQGMYDKGWMDVEDVYQKAGWEVEFDKPGYNEDYEANFKFSK
jgi:hypothetical protein